MVQDYVVELTNGLERRVYELRVRERNDAVGR